MFLKEVKRVPGEVVIFNDSGKPVEFFCYDAADNVCCSTAMKKKCVAGRCCALKANSPYKMQVFADNKPPASLKDYGQKYIFFGDKYGAEKRGSGFHVVHGNEERDGKIYW
jgi:hypothetical protein